MGYDYMNYMDLDVQWPRKVIKLNQSLIHSWNY